MDWDWIGCLLSSLCVVVAAAAVQQACLSSTLPWIPSHHQDKTVVAGPLNS